ncbi:MAG: stalk domain-containing protein, partial [Chitinophagales bacterium]
INGEEIKSQPQPYLKSNRVFVPLRVISVSLGATVAWDQNSRIVSINKDDLSIIMPLGTDRARVNQNTVKLEAVPEIKAGRAMVPLRFVGESLGVDVAWDGATRTVTISSKKQVSPPSSNTNTIPGQPQEPPEQQQQQATPQPTKGKALSDSEKWAWATAAVLIKNQGLDLNILGGAIPDETNMEKAQDVLSELWYVDSREDAIEIIREFQTTGNSQEYQEYQSYLNEMTEDEIEECVSGFDEQEQFAYDNRDTIGTRKLIAWDQSRVVFVAGYSYVAGYFTDAEALTYILNAAREIQRYYTSWDDFGKNYLLGREFWTLIESDTSDILNQETRVKNQLMSDQNGPWVKLKWSTPL